MKINCRWGDAVLVEVLSRGEDVTMYKADFLSVYTYPFTLGPSVPSMPSIDPMILDFCERYQVTLGQIHPSF